MPRPSVPVDTDPSAFAILVDRWRSMGVTGRAALTEQLCRDAERIARAGIAAQHPRFTEPQILHELARRRYGAALADAAYADLLPSE